MATAKARRRARSGYARKATHTGLNTLAVDPTRTTMLRRRFMAALGGRARRLRGAVRQLIVTDDAFGINATTPWGLAANTLTTNRRWAFENDAGKVQGFQQWFEEQAAAEILGTAPGTNPAEPWTTPYTKSAYMQGATRAYADTHTEAIAAGMSNELYEGGAAQFLNDAFGGKVGTNRIALLATRNFEQLKGFNAAMGTELNRILSAGISNGTSTTKLANEINAKISGMTKARAMTIARTEIVHAHAEGQLDSFDAMNVELVGVMAEWATAGDARVCPMCQPLEGVILKVAEARGLIPRHPNCRCAWLPSGIGEATTGQSWAKDIIDDLFLDSMKAEHPNAVGGKAARSASKWQGAARKIKTKSHLKPTKANLKKAAAKHKAAQAATQAGQEHAAAALASQKNTALAARAAEKVAKQAAADKAAAKAQAAAAELHSQKIKAGMAKGQLKTQYPTLDEGDFGLGANGVARLKASGWNKMAKQAFDVGHVVDGKLLEAAAWDAVRNADDLAAQWAGYKAHLPGMHAKAAWFKKHGFPMYAKPTMDGLVGPSGKLTLAGMKKPFVNVPDDFKPTSSMHAKLLGAKDLKAQMAIVDELKAEVDDLVAAFAAAEAKKAADGAAAKLVHSHKVKLGMAKSHYKKKFGAGDSPADYLGADKLSTTGMTKVLLGKGYLGFTDGKLPGGVLGQLLDAKDIVAQKAVLDKIKPKKSFKIASKPKSVPPKAAPTGVDDLLPSLANPTGDLLQSGMHPKELPKLSIKGVKAGFNDLGYADKYIQQGMIDVVHPSHGIAGQKASLKKFKEWVATQERVLGFDPILVLDDDGVLPVNVLKKMFGTDLKPNDFNNIMLADTLDDQMKHITQPGVLKFLKKPGTAPGKPLPSIGDFTPAPDDLKTSGLLKSKVLGKLLPKGLDDATLDAIDLAGDLDAQLAMVKAARAKKIATAGLPEPAGLTYVKDLPGSTAPTLQKDAAGKLWVQKETSGSLKPAHIVSEGMADDLYRAAGLRVPKGGIVTTAEGPVKLTEFLDGGETLQQWMAHATKAQIKAMDEEISRGFVADALFANHDVAGLSNDNIFIVAGKPYRIDNGGALAYRAQGGKKATWGSTVDELASMRDAATNSNTARLFKGITDKDIEEQIRDLVDRRDAILKAVATNKHMDAAARTQVAGVLGKRLDYLEGMLPKRAAKKVGTGRSAAAAYDINAATVQRIKRSRINGSTMAGDKDMVEDNNVLVWQQKRVDGSTVTRMRLKVNAKGSRNIEEVLGDSMAKARKTSGSKASNIHPQDSYFEDVKKTAKTVNVHAQDKAYNEATLEHATKLKETLHGITPLDDQHAAMLNHYTEMLEEIFDAKAAGTGTPKYNQFVYKPPKVKAPTTAPEFKVRQTGVELPTSDFKNGYATGTMETNELPGTMFEVELGDDGSLMRFIPSDGTRGRKDGLALHGMVDLELEGEVTQAQLKRMRATMKSMGVDITPPTAEAEELLYLHKTINARQDASKSTYKAIQTSGKTDAQKIKDVKAWVKTNYDIKLPVKPNEWYKPHGTTTTSFGDGYRVWDRWDMKNSKLSNYTLQHTMGSLDDSTRNTIPARLELMLQNGGEATSSAQRLRKGVNLRATGGASTRSDVNTGGADFFMTRLRKNGSVDRGEGVAGIFFKHRNARRVDAVHYRGDNFGAIDSVGSRASTMDDMIAYSSNSSNEFILKNNVSLLDELDYIRVYNASERKQLIEIFAKNGVDKLPDGRTVADIIITKGQKSKLAKRIKE